MGRGGGGAFFIGLALLVVGVGATVFSYTHAAAGGTYVVFTGLIIGGLIRMVTALIRGAGPSGYKGGRSKYRAENQKPAWYEDSRAEYVEKLADVPSGHCWQCGSKLRRGRRLCMACGAAQNSVTPERESTATPGMMTFGPPPKLADSPHPYDAAGTSPRPATPSQPRTYLPADPEGSYGWGPAYAGADERNNRSNPGYAPPGYAPAGRGPRPDERRPQQGGRAGTEQRRYSGELPPNPRGRPPVDGGSDYRRPPRSPHANSGGWDEDEGDDYNGGRRSAPRQAPRPHAGRPNGGDGYSRGERRWDDDDDFSSGRHRGRR